MDYLSLPEEEKNKYISVYKAEERFCVGVESLKKSIENNEIRGIYRPGCKVKMAYIPDLEKKYPKREEKEPKSLGLAAAAKFLKINRLEFYKLIKDGILETDGEGFDAKISLSNLKDYRENMQANEEPSALS